MEIPGEGNLGLTSKVRFKGELMEKCKCPACLRKGRYSMHEIDSGCQKQDLKVRAWFTCPGCQKVYVEVLETRLLIQQVVEKDERI